MFHSSTQRKFWTFKSDKELAKGREAANLRYRNRYQDAESRSDDDDFFLTVDEERQLLRWYDDRLLKDFCHRFKPEIPINCTGTACHYVKRLYLRYSVMDYNPTLMILASIWLACKTEEFNISMDQFVWNVHNLLPDERIAHGEDFSRKYGDAILAIELILIKELNFHLTVHNPFRAFEGLLIDMKTRYESATLKKPEILRDPTIEILYSALFTDAILLYTPSQLALAALLSAGGKLNIILDSYVTDHLLKDQPQHVLEATIKNVKKIRSIIRKNTKLPPEHVINSIKAKLEKCLNKTSDPLTVEYARVKNLEVEERERIATQKWREEAERQKQMQKDLLDF